MDKFERLQAHLAGEPADRPAAALWRHFPVDDQEPDDLAAAALQFQAEYDWDFVKFTPASSFCLKDWGAQDVWRGHPEGTREYTRRVIERPEDWLQLQPLDPEAGHLGAQLQALARLGQGLQGRTPFIQTVFSPLSQARNLAERAEHGLNEGRAALQALPQPRQGLQLRAQVAGFGIQRLQLQPVFRALDHPPGVFARALRMAAPDILRAPVLEAKGAGRRELDKVPVVLGLKLQRGRRQIVRLLVVHRKMAPQRRRRTV